MTARKRTPETKCREGYDRPKMWSVMRFHREFSGTDVCIATEARMSAFLHFVNALQSVGVVEKVADHTPWLPSVRYRLVRDLGPRTPVVRRVYEVYDPNSKGVLAKVQVMGHKANEAAKEAV